jgi:hypothetical protein
MTKMPVATVIAPVAAQELRQHPSSALRLRRTLLDTADLENADHGNPGSDFCEGRFVAARHCSVPYFSFV